MASSIVLSSRLASWRMSQSSCSDSLSWLAFVARWCGMLFMLVTLPLEAAAVTAADPGRLLDLAALSCFLVLYRTSLRVALAREVPGEGGVFFDPPLAMPSSLLSFPSSISASFLLMGTVAPLPQLAMFTSRASRTALHALRAISIEVVSFLLFKKEHFITVDLLKAPPMKNDR